MAYPQAPIEMDIYMELPQGIEATDGNSKDHVLKVARRNANASLATTAGAWVASVVRKR